MFFRGILFTLCQLLGPESVDVAVGPYLEQVLNVVTEMHFGLVTWFQQVSHDFAVFQEYFDPLDVVFLFHRVWSCLLYTSDAADEEDSVDLGGRRIIKK